MPVIRLPSFLFLAFMHHLSTITTGLFLILGPLEDLEESAQLDLPSNNRLSHQSTSMSYETFEEHHDQDQDREERPRVR